MNKNILVKGIIISVASITLLMSLSACGVASASASDSANKIKTEKQESLKSLAATAKKEGKVVSVGMPDDWADWKDTWGGITTKYGIQHNDTDMSSAEEISKFTAEANNPTADIGDVGAMFAPIAVEKGVTQPYKTSYWDQVPSWAKDKDGNWMVAYQGTMSFITDTKLVSNAPKTWKDVEKGNYKVSVGDVTKAASSQNVVLSAAYAFGGSEKNIEPAIDFFAKLAKEGRLLTNDSNAANLEKGEVQVGVLWDFNALALRDKLGKDSFTVTIPNDGAVVSGYSTIINKYAPDPAAAKLAREYIFSDAGQINLARGYARPIRSNVKLPADVKAKTLPASDYKNAKPVKDTTAWTQTMQNLPQLWQEKVLIYVK